MTPIYAESQEHLRSVSQHPGTIYSRTGALRYVMRSEGPWAHRVLQEGWRDLDTGAEHWRDVPTVDEEEVAG